MKAVRGTPKHLAIEGELDGFTYLMLNLKYSCNYNCMKCFNQANGIQIYQNYDLLSIEDRINLVHESSEIGARAVVLAGEGEPLLNYGIKQIVSEIDSCNMIPIIYSNGSILSRENADFFKEKNADIVISLDSLDSSKYDMLTGTTGCLEKVLKNIEYLREIYRDSIVEKDDLKILGIAINATVSGKNISDIASIKEFCGDDVYFICNPLARLGSANENWNQLMQGRENEDLALFAGQMSESGGPLMLGKNGMCNYSSNGIAVSPYGHYMTCAYTSETNGLLGSVGKLSIKDAYAYKSEMESLHISRFGPSPCLIRSLDFKKYLDRLRSA